MRGPKQKELVQLLSLQGETAMDALTGFSRATIKALQDSRIIEMVEREADPRCLYDDVDPDRPPELMPAQAAAVHRIG
ncbi:MAG TPA: hypothetical protein DCO77_09800, partial [Nitrospiraceae bacterium]|nr:hypothetical protein [Nitrospiraceae bacterium]